MIKDAENPVSAETAAKLAAVKEQKTKKSTGAKKPGRLRKSTAAAPKARPSKAKPKTAPQKGRKTAKPSVSKTKTAAGSMAKTAAAPKTTTPKPTGKKVHKGAAASKKANTKTGVKPEVTTDKPPLESAGGKTAAAPKAGKKKPAAKTVDDKPAGKNGVVKKSSSSKSKNAAQQPALKLLINAEEPEECRIALLEDGKLDSFYVESISRERTKGNIYKGRIVSIETNLQAAFVDIGTGKNSFLPFSEIHPEYYSKELPADLHWKDVNFRERLKIGQEILLEVVREATGNKGANMTSFLSLPGRYVVLMPGSDSHGISRQIESPEQRHKLRDMLEDCKLPEGVGYIIRTASKGITKTALTEDVRFLVKLWNDIRRRGQTTPAPALIYGEQNIVTRFLRDHFTADIQEILVDSQDAFAQVKNFIDLLPVAQRNKTAARLHKGPRPLLNSHNIEEQIEQIYQPTVKLPSGGSIVIDPTEALVAIDVNSGSTGKDKNFAETIFLANMEAAEELARQLRLRDLGGLIVVDFIDMRSAANIREVEKKVKNSMKRDKAKVDFARISKFGLMQISRQRMGSPIAARNYVTCECCQGRGVIRSVETQALAYLRQIQTGCTRKTVKTIRCHLPLEVSQYLLNKKRAELAEMERQYRVNIAVEIDTTLKPAAANIEFLKEG